MITTVIVPRGIDAKFVHHLLRSVPFQEEYYRHGSGIVADLWSTRWSGMKSIPLAIPSHAEQLAIANYLDRETAEIDAFIADQEELIALLTERRAATISHAVTKGLDPNVPMKDSGVEWLGEVPAHWSVAKVGIAYGLSLGKMVNAAAGDGTPRNYVRAGNIQEYGLDLSEVKTLNATASEARALSIKKGDTLVVEGGAGFGRSDYICEDLPGWIFQNHVIRARPRRPNSHSGRFLDYFVRSLRARGHFESLSAFATIPNLSSEKLASIEFPIVKYDEQNAIADYLDDETAQIDATIADAREAIALSKERRAALISAAVTGKIDVREEAA